MSGVGPSVQLIVRCDPCVYSESKRYSVQGDSGSEVYCNHPAVCTADKGRYIADTSWVTPEWCPVRQQAIAAFKETI